jgi:aromatic ring-opening dioxygenase catalytic subunit (LigB family)
MLPAVTTASTRQPSVFVGQGVPEVLAADERPTRAWMGRFGATLRARSPGGIVCVSASFVAPAFTVTTADASLARRVIEQLLPAGLKPRSDPSRGIAEGASAPLSFLFPEADVPVVEVSLHESLDAEMHFALGRALEPLRDQGVLIVGIGSVTHDLADHERISRNRDAADVLGERSKRFQAWVVDMVTQPASYARARGLTRFRDHPDAHAVHATGADFLPLVVVAGAASRNTGPESAGVMVHAGCQRGLSMAAFAFER